MKFNDKKIVVFDFDGTLVDSMETFADIAGKVMEDIYGTPFETARRQYVETSGLPFFQQLEQIHPGDERNKKASDEFETKKIEGYFEQQVYSDASALIEHLVAKGIKTAISSNNFQHLVDEFLRRTHINVDFALGFREENFCKGRSHFEHLLEKCSYAKKAMLFVGDSLKDAERALDFGIDFVGKTGLFKKNEFQSKYPQITVVDSLEELIQFI